METPTQTLHRLTSYDPEREWDVALDDPRIVQDLQTNDISRLPWFYKRYASGLPRTALPRDLPVTSASTVDVLAGIAEVPRRHVDLAHLARLLHLSAGVVRTTERPYGTFLYRAAGSAGGRFPLELYVAAPEGSGVPAGVHWYHPRDHALVRIAPPPRNGAPSVIVTGVPWRTGWRYAERGYRHVYWDAGTMLAQLLAAADSAAIPAHLYTEFPDELLADLVCADGAHEWPLAVIGLGDGTPAFDATGSTEAGAVDASPVEFPLITAAQRAGDLRAWGSAWERGTPTKVAAPDSPPVEEVVLARGSQRRMDRTRGLPKDVLQVSMDVALRGTELPHFVVVHDVEGVGPGLYRYPDLGTPVRAGAMRDELYRICLDQDLASDAAFVVIAAIDVSGLDDHQYRDAQLAAGLVEGRLHLLAYALGASASGMTFIDSEVPALLGEGLDALLFTCVGVPEYKGAPGGSPGAPTAVRQVTPRLSDPTTR